MGLGEAMWDEVRTFESLGKDAVDRHDKTILKHAEKHNLDPDLIRAVMFAEHARGHYGGLNHLADAVGRSCSILPMNIQNERWNKLVDKKPEDFYDSDVNIEAGTILLSRIRERVKDKTPENIGTFWNELGAKRTNKFGEFIGEAYRTKPWKKL